MPDLAPIATTPATAGEAAAHAEGAPPLPISPQQSAEQRLEAGKAKAARAIERDLARAAKHAGASSAEPAEPKAGEGGTDGSAAAEGEPAEKESAEAEGEPEGEDKAKSQGTQPPSRTDLAAKAHVLRRHESRLQSQLSEVKALAEQLRAERAELAPWRTLAEQVRTDPTKAIEQLAERTGQSPARLYEQIARKQLGKSPDAESLAGEVGELRAQLEQMRAAETKRAQLAEQRVAYLQAQSRDLEVVRAAIRDAANEQFFPIASSLDDATLKAEIVGALESCYQHDPYAGHDRVAEMVEQRFRAEVDRYRGNPKLLQRVRALLDETDTGPGRDNRDTRAPARGGASRSTKASSGTPTNRDAANGGSDRRLSSEEKLALAADALRKGAITS